MTGSDVCIIGAGPAGCVSALALARRGLRVTVLESGPRFSEQRKAELARLVKLGRQPGRAYRLAEPRIERYRNNGPDVMPLDEERVRAVGGTSLHWLGNCPRLLEDDFRLRSTFGVGADWPIGYPDLEPYYARAEQEIGISGAGDNPFAGPRSSPFPMPPIPFSYSDRILRRTTDRLGIEFHHTPQARNSVPYGGRSQCLSCAQCAFCPTGAKATFDRTHGDPAEATGRVQIRSEVTTLRIELDRQGRAVRAVYAGLDRVEHAQEAQCFIIAGGAIETARLLLLSRSALFPDGLANRSGLVGRGLMNHPLVAVEGTLDQPTFPHRVGFESTESFQFYATRTRDRVAGYLLNMSNQAGRGPAGYLKDHDAWGDDLARRITPRYGRAVRITAQVEELPDDHNTVTLDPQQQDYFAQPIPLVTYRIGPYAAAGLADATTVLRHVLEEAGAAGITPAARGWPGHHLGTTRMGTDPNRSVVDPYLRTHDVPNLYLVTTGAFPTGGAANPTLTLAALALRTADHIGRGPK